jgi:hypothetical protein
MSSGGIQDHRSPAPGRRPVSRLARWVCLLAVCCAACAGPSDSAGDYRGMARHTAKDLAGVVASARLAGRQYLDGRLPQNYADYVISQAESNASSIQTTFDSRQPPDQAADDLRSKVDDPLQEVTGDLTDLRVALRAGDRDKLSKTLDDLAKPLKTLNDLEEQL